MIGRVFDDRYEVVRKLGSGGMADVYLANDRLLGRQVALKILSTRYAHDEQFVERFRREASSAAGLNHPNIVQIYDRGEAEGTYYIAMEYLEGRSLKEIIVKYAPLSPELLVSVSVQILEALRFAHRRDVIHRDIKPQNIIVDNEGRVKVTDFGIARAGSASTMTEAGSILGTAHYLSPEQAQGQPVEAASDLYSLGVVMYEMATGQPPLRRRQPGEHRHAARARHAGRAAEPRSRASPRTSRPSSCGRWASGPSTATSPRRPCSTICGGCRRASRSVAPAGFTEEATRVMTPGGAAAAAGAAGAGAAHQVRRRPPDMPAPVIEPDERAGPRRERVAVDPGDHPHPGAGRRRLRHPLQLEHRRRPSMAAVPGVVGLSEADAQAEDRGRRASSSRRRARSRPPTWPRATSPARTRSRTPSWRRARPSAYWISSGEGKVEVPDVGRHDPGRGGRRAGAARAWRSPPSPRSTPTSRSGTVLRQNPEAGKKVDAGTTVTITVAAASNTVEVPPLIGMNQDDADRSRSRAWAWCRRWRRSIPPSPAGRWSTRIPRAGAEVQPGRHGHHLREQRARWRPRSRCRRWRRSG